MIDSDVCINAISKRDTSPIEAIRRTRPDRIALSVIAYGEVQTGILRSWQRERDERNWDDLVALLEILPVTREIAGIWAALRGNLRAAGVTIGDNDLLIGATAIAHGMVLATRNLRHFAWIPGLDILTLEGPPPRRR